VNLNNGTFEIKSEPSCDKNIRAAAPIPADPHHRSFAVELGYHVTLVKDATAAFSPDGMRAAHELNGPTFAHAL
jgi:nicotinamidase-related amidase